MPLYTMRDQAQLYVREFGIGEPVLVLSGLGMQSWQWLPYLLPQGRNYRFIIPDWRGFGGSANCPIPQEDAISSHWQDLQSLMSKLPFTRYKVIAYSMGATTAMHGMQYGDFAQHVSAYLHIDQTPKIASDEEWSYGLLGEHYKQLSPLLQQVSNFLAEHQHHQNLEQLPAQLRLQLVHLWMKFLSLQDNTLLSSRFVEKTLNNRQVQQFILPMHRLDYMKWYIDNYLHHREDYREALKTLQAPATFFIGAKSSLYHPLGQHQVADSLPQAQKVVFQRSGHAPLISEPVKFTRALHHFLKSA